jgi:hypothetical protein
MARYIEFTTDEGQTLLVEVEEDEAPRTQGVMKAGLLERRSTDALASAKKSFDDAVTTIVGQNVESFTRAVSHLKKPPEEVELLFALKATGEVGNFAVAR